MKIFQALLNWCGKYLQQNISSLMTKYYEYIEVMEYLCFIFIIQMGIFLKHIDSIHVAVSYVTFSLLQLTRRTSATLMLSHVWPLSLPESLPSLGTVQTSMV